MVTCSICISGTIQSGTELAVAMDGRGATPRHSVDLVGKVLPMPQHMHAQLHKQYVAQSGTKLSCQTRLQSTHEVVIVIPGRLVVSGRGKTRTRCVSLLVRHDGGQQGKGVVRSLASQDGEAGPAARRPHPHCAICRAAGKQRCTAQLALAKLQKVHNFTSGV